MEIIDQKTNELNSLLKQMGDQQKNLLTGEINEKEKSIFYSNAEKAKNLIKSIKKDLEGKNTIE